MVRRFFSAAVGTLGKLNVSLGVVAGSLLVVVTLITTYEVVTRYFFNRPTSWTLETSTYLLLYLIFLGAGYIFQIEGHIRVDILLLRLRERPREILNTVTTLLCLVFAVVLFWKGTEFVMEALRHGWISTSVLEVWLFPIYLVVPVGSFLMCLAAMVNVSKHLRNALSAGERGAGR